jgi:hypothetical protein
MPGLRTWFSKRSNNLISHLEEEGVIRCWRGETVCVCRFELWRVPLPVEDAASGRNQLTPTGTSLEKAAGGGKVSVVVHAAALELKFQGKTILVTPGFIK